MTQSIERVLQDGFFPRFEDEDAGVFWKKIESHADTLRRGGVTHLRVNDAPLSILEVMDPENSYMRFTTFGYSLDKYVTSTWNEGIYHPSILELNRKALLYQVGMAKRFGFRCFMRCVEMTLMPESFFLRHPSLRGPRVDNPVCSTSPRFALCPMLPEVQDHYRQMIRKLLELAPDLDEMHIFTNDSGSGFCYSSHLYSGPNGPGNCRNVPAGKQAQSFARILLEAGREVNPQFRIVMTSGLSPKEKDDFLESAPEGVASSIFGAFAWGGGLEDRWQNFAVGAEIHQAEVRQQARAWALADMRARARSVTKHGGLVYASYNPDYYSGPSDAPRPFEVQECLLEYNKLGVRNIIGGAWGTPYHANGAILKQFLDDGPLEVTAAVRKLAVNWVGEAFADSLCGAWRCSEFADREWPSAPSGGYAFFVDPVINYCPLVPDFAALPPGSLDYFLTTLIRDALKMKEGQGGLWRRRLHCSDATKAYIVRQMDGVVIPSDQKALDILTGLLAKGISQEARACVEVQIKEIGVHLCHSRRIRNLFEAAFHLIASCAKPDWLHPLPEIIDLEIENSLRWAAFTGVSDPKATARLNLMKAHRLDPVSPADLSAFQPSEYRGLDAWPGAHRDIKE